MARFCVQDAPCVSSWHDPQHCTTGKLVHTMWTQPYDDPAFTHHADERVNEMNERYLCKIVLLSVPNLYIYIYFHSVWFFAMKPDGVTTGRFRLANSL